MGLIWIAVFCAFNVAVCRALKDTNIHIPSTVIQGNSVILACSYDLESETLYSVKWYKGNNEFFRYTPKDDPQFKQFPVKKLFIRMSVSNSTHVVLLNVSRENAGYYSCEISADVPSFSTAMSTGYMKVVELPKTDPYITGLKSRYHIGESVRANCTLEDSYPAANITWLQNGHLADLRYVKNHSPILSYHTGQYTAHSILRFTIQKSLFMHKTTDRQLLKIRCVARIYDIYHRSVETSIELKKRKKISSIYLPVTSTETTTTEETTEEMQPVNFEDDDSHHNWIANWTPNFITSLYSNSGVATISIKKLYFSIVTLTLILPHILLKR